MIATRGGTGAFRAGPFSGTLLVAWGEAPIVVSFLVLRSMVAAFLAGSISTALVVGSFWTLLTSENSTAGPNVIAPLVALTAVAMVASAEAMARWLRHRAER